MNCVCRRRFTLFPVLLKRFSTSSNKIVSSEAAGSSLSIDSAQVAERFVKLLSLDTNQLLDLKLHDRIIVNDRRVSDDEPTMVEFASDNTIRVEFQTANQTYRNLINNPSFGRTIYPIKFENKTSFGAGLLLNLKTLFLF